jgi:hypothetical protein
VRAGGFSRIKRKPEHRRKMLLGNVLEIGKRQFSALKSTEMSIFGLFFAVFEHVES